MSVLIALSLCVCVFHLLREMECFAMDGWMCVEFSMSLRLHCTKSIHFIIMLVSPSSPTTEKCLFFDITCEFILFTLYVSALTHPTHILQLNVKMATKSFLNLYKIPCGGLNKMGKLFFYDKLVSQTHANVQQRWIIFVLFCVSKIVCDNPWWTVYFFHFGWTIYLFSLLSLWNCVRKTRWSAFFVSSWSHKISSKR